MKINAKMEKRELGNGLFTLPIIKAEDEIGTAEGEQVLRIDLQTKKDGVRSVYLRVYATEKSQNYFALQAGALLTQLEYEGSTQDVDITDVINQNVGKNVQVAGWKSGLGGRVNYGFTEENINITKQAVAR